MLAYVDGEVAGWCGFGPRPRLPRLEHSRTIPKIDDLAGLVDPVLQRPGRLPAAGRRRRAARRRRRLRSTIRRAGRRGLPDRPGGRPRRRRLRLRGRHADVRQAGLLRVVETAAHSDRRPRILMRLMFEASVGGAGAREPDVAARPLRIKPRRRSRPSQARGRRSRRHRPRSRSAAMAPRSNVHRRRERPGDEGGDQRDHARHRREAVEHVAGTLIRVPRSVGPVRRQRQTPGRRTGSRER